MDKPRNYEAEFAVKLRHIIRGAFSSRSVGGIIEAIRERDIARDAGLAKFLESYGPTFKHTNDPGACGTLIAEFREQEESNGQAE